LVNKTTTHSLYFFFTLSINKVTSFIMPRKAGVPNKITSVIKERLAIILNEAMDSIDVE